MYARPVANDALDTEALVAGARAEVARRMGARDYPDALLKRLESEFVIPPRDFGSAPEALAHVPSGRALHSDSRWGAITIAAKRVVRRMLAWYIHPITVDQSRFNAAIVAELRRLEDRVRTLEPPPGNPTKASGDVREGPRN